MKFFNINDFLYFKKLKNNFLKIKKTNIRKLFDKDKNRFNNFSILLKNNILIDFSRNLIDKSTINLLVKLSNEINLSKKINYIFNTFNSYNIDNNPIFYIIWRYKKNLNYIFDNNILNKIYIIKDKIRNICNLIENKLWLGYTNKYITDIVCISNINYKINNDFIINSLKNFKNNKLLFHYIYDLDKSNTCKLLNNLNPERTLFIVISKYFNEKEILDNFYITKHWIINNSKSKKYLNNHFIIITNKLEYLNKFGISKENIIEISSWIRDRYSIWSSACILISLYIGFNNYMELLNGAYFIDNYFVNSPIDKNISIILSLINIWYSLFFKSKLEGIFLYNKNMKYFIEYYEQLIYSSNSKIFDINNNSINYNTCLGIFGSYINNNRCNFYQFIINSNEIFPCDFIFVCKNYLKYFQDDHDLLFANFISKVDSLSFGNTINYFDLNTTNNNKYCLGNKPSNIILLNELNPYNLGMLIALYEYKIFTKSILLNINHLDESIIDFGNSLFKNIIFNLKSENQILDYNLSTNSIINFYKYSRNI